MANRSAKIAGRVRALFGGVSAQQMSQDLIFQTMDDVQRRICEDTLCNERSMTLSVSAGTNSYDLTELGGIAVTESAFGLVNGLGEAIVNIANTTLTWDTPFTETYTDLSAATAPKYRFIVQEARVGGTGVINETIVIVEQTLDHITLRSSSNNTLVKFVCVQYSTGGLSHSQALDPSGFFRLHYIQLPSSFQFQLEEVSPIIRDFNERWPRVNVITGQNPEAFSVLADVITFYPSIAASEDYTLHYYAIPTTDLSPTVNPEISESFDTALYYGTIAELAPAFNKDLFIAFSQKYQNEIERVMAIQQVRKSYQGHIAYHDF